MNGHSRASATSSPPPKGVVLDLSGETPVNADNASVGNHVTVSSKFANVAFFRKYANKTGTLQLISLAGAASRHAVCTLLPART